MILENSFILLIVLALITLNYNASAQTSTSAELKLFSQYASQKDYFGHSTAIIEHWIFVSAYSASIGIDYSGAVFAFHKNSTNSTWIEKQIITATEKHPHSYFGGCIAAYSDTLIVGAYQDHTIESESGVAYIYRLLGEQWIEVQKITSFSQSADFFGHSVDIFSTSIAVGAYGHSNGGFYRGAVYVFELNKERKMWDQQVVLMPSDVQDYHQFGYSVAIVNDTVAVGAYGDGDETDGSNCGAVYIFRRMYVVLTDDDISKDRVRWRQQAKLRAATPVAHSNFGISLSLTLDSPSYDPSVDFVVLAVGANRESGIATASGVVYIFQSVLGQRWWSQKARLFALDSKEEQLFGTAVSIQQGNLIVGAPDDSEFGVDGGSGYLFSKNRRDIWGLVTKLHGNDTAHYDNFGYDCIILI